VAARPTSGGLLADDGVQKESAPEITVAAGAHVKVTVGFTSVEAYQVFDDRFAFRVGFAVDGEALEVVAETHVVRVTPLEGR
jgi:hypothetical protein